MSSTIKERKYFPEIYPSTERSTTECFSLCCYFQVNRLAKYLSERHQIKVDHNRCVIDLSLSALFTYLSMTLELRQYFFNAYTSFVIIRALVMVKSPYDYHQRLVYEKVHFNYQLVDKPATDNVNEKVNGSIVPVLFIIAFHKILQKSNRGPKRPIWAEQDECGFIEFEPFSCERENFHVCWSTGTHLCLHVEYRILHSSIPSINNRCCNKHLREYNATTRFKQSQYLFSRSLQS